MVYSVGEIAENPPAQEVLLPVWNICAGIRPCILELIFLPVRLIPYYADSGKQPYNEASLLFL